MVFELILLPLSFMVLLILFKCNKTAKYYIKLIFYHISIILLSWLLIPFFLIRPKDVKNLLSYAEIAKHLTTILGIKWTLRGEEHLRQNKSCVIVSNHQTCFDVLGMFNIWNIVKRMTGIAKKELLYFFPGLYLAGTVFIDRNNPKGRVVLNEALEKLKKDNVKLWIFPEGTRRNTGEIHAFKKGAFYTAIYHQVPIVPLVYSSYRHFMDQEKKMLNKGKMIIQALPEISTTGLTVKDADDLMERTRQQMIDIYEKISLEVAENSKLK